MKLFIKILGLIFLISISYPLGYSILESNIALKDKVSSFPDHGSQSLGVYLINLDRSPERYAYVRESLETLGFPYERIAAIDGKNLSSKEIQESVDLATYHQWMGHLPKVGMIGCCLSHMKAWETFLASPYECALIFEDDVSFEPSHLRTAIESLLRTPTLWDINSFEISHKGTPLCLKKIGQTQELVLYLTEITHAGAYLINRKAAKRLLEKSLPIKMPIDHYFARPWEMGLIFTGVESPRLVFQTHGTSEIGKTQHVSEDRLSFVLEIKRGLQKFQSYIIRFFYNVCLYIKIKMEI